MERVNDLKEFKIKTSLYREISVNGKDNSLGEVSIYLKNLMTDEEIATTLNKSDLKILISELIDIGNFKADEFEEKYYRYKLPEIFEECNEKDVFLYQELSSGKIKLKGSNGSQLYCLKGYKNKFTNKEFKSLLETYPELSVLKKKEVIPNKITVDIA